jgi:hypothetical protein
MKNPFHARAPTYDAAAITAIIDRALACAGLSTSSMPLQDLGATIRRAMSPTGACRVAIPAATDQDPPIDVSARVTDSDLDQVRSSGTSSAARQVPGPTSFSCLHTSPWPRVR